MPRQIDLTKLLSWLIIFVGFSNNPSIAKETADLTIAFGSCADQNRQQPIWNTVAEHKPDLFIFMGDNVYIDSSDPIKMTNAYQTLANEPYFSEFRKDVPIVATWDDHDYGIFDGGKEFTGKYDAKKSFIYFFNYPEINRLTQLEQGLFHTRWLKFKDKNIQVILLDTRWYRDELVKTYLSVAQRTSLKLGPYQPNLDQSSTMLGEQQWKWLEGEFKKTADLRILVSSIQVLPEFSGWETWANFPHERERLLNLIQQNKSETIILSGDAHHAEISSLQHRGQRILEITSSGLAVKTYPMSTNIHRQGKSYDKLNYGILSIKEDEKITVVADIFSAAGDKALTVKLGE